MSQEVMRAAAASRGKTAVVTVMAARGSVPRHPGSKMLVRPDGSITGTVGGGRGEAAAIERARRCIQDGVSSVLTVEMLGARAEGTDPICGGTATMLVELVEDPAPYQAGLALLDGGGRALLVKEVPGPQGRPAGGAAVSVLDETGKPVHGNNPRIREATASRCLARGRPAYEEEERLFYDPLFPEERLLVLGGGHVGLALAALASRLDFSVTVVDERPEFASPARFPRGVRVVCGRYAETVARFPFDSATYVVIVTPGHVSDLDCVRAVLKRTYRYAGFIGSARKTALVLAQARNDGFPAEAVDALYAPIGLDIGAETPEEIAVAILGELIAVRRNSRSQPAMERGRRARRTPQGS